MMCQWRVRSRHSNYVATSWLTRGWWLLSFPCVQRLCGAPQCCLSKPKVHTTECKSRLPTFLTHTVFVCVNLKCIKMSKKMQNECVEEEKKQPPVGSVPQWLTSGASRPESCCLLKKNRSFLHLVALYESRTPVDQIISLPSLYGRAAVVKVIHTVFWSQSVWDIAPSLSRRNCRCTLVWGAPCTFMLVIMFVSVGLSEIGE